MIPLTADVENLSFDLPLPDNAGTGIICIKLEGMVNHTTMTGHSSKGMRFVKVLSDCVNTSNRTS